MEMHTIVDIAVFNSFTCGGHSSNSRLREFFLLSLFAWSNSVKKKGFLPLNYLSWLALMTMKHLPWRRKYSARRHGRHSKCNEEKQRLLCVLFCDNYLYAIQSNQLFFSISMENAGCDESYAPFSHPFHPLLFLYTLRIYIRSLHVYPIRSTPLYCLIRQKMCEPSVTLLRRFESIASRHRPT